MYNKDLTDEEHETLLEWSTKKYGTSARGTETDARWASAGKTENGRPSIADNSDIASKNFCIRFTQAPCGDSAKGIKYVTIIVTALLAWALLYTLLEQEVAPGGQLFQLIMLTILSCLCGWLVSLVHLPPLLGMLLSGIAVQNLGLFEMTGVYTEIVVTIREIALTVMLLEAGLGLDPTALKKLSFVVARLAFLPCVAETVAAALAAYVLMDMPWLWGLLLGFILSAVSPAVVVPSLLSLKKKGYGEAKGISTLVIAASSVDDVLAISGFGVVLGMVFSQGDVLTNLLHGPIEVSIGIVIGLGCGVLGAFIPHRNEDNLTLKRSFVVGIGGLVAVLGSQMYGYSGSGPLAAIILAFLASLCWKWQGWSGGYNPVADNFSKMWATLEPILFGLIGTEIKFANINAELMSNGAGIILFGLVIRCFACSVALIGARLNPKEVIFVNITWMPKATLQATLGPVALDLAKKYNREDAIPWAQDILSIAVLSILVTAPLGAIGISLGGPRLLSQDEPMKKNKKDQPIVVAVIDDVMV